MITSIGNSWDKLLCEEFKKDYFIQLCKFIDGEYANYSIYPNEEDIFNSLKFTPYEQVKAVIIGQDPYHGKGQAHGLCFSVKNGVKLPPSLKNIFKELQSDLEIPIPNNGELTNWAKQGVLMLNSVLTVRDGMANSHKGKGWEILTDEIIRKINAKNKPVAFVLWGADAGKKEKFLTNPIHGVFKAAHPSPLSAYNGFFGCKHFSKVNIFLENNGVEPINWRLDGH